MSPNQPATSGDPSVESELADLQLRLAAQDRLIEAMVDENAEIHELRRRNHQLEQYVGRLLELPGVQAALKVRRRVLRRTEPADD